MGVVRIAPIERSAAAVESIRTHERLEGAEACEKRIDHFLSASLCYVCPEPVLVK